MDNSAVDVLVLGAGWTSQFLVPLFEQERITYALTTTTGKPNKSCQGKYKESDILPFVFQPDPDPKSPDASYDSAVDERQYTNLPQAKTIIITFKLEGEGQARKLVNTYQKSHTLLPNFIQLGSTGIWKEDKPQNRESPYEQTSRAIAEDELRDVGGSVLNLAGLWGAERVPWNWLERVASTKEKLRGKQALHLIHGKDVARACVALHRRFYPSERYLLTDQKVYDWWQLTDWWADSLTQNQNGVRLEYRKWLSEIMSEEGLKSLPRSSADLGRVLDSSDFWQQFSIEPEVQLSKEAKANI